MLKAYTVKTKADAIFNYIYGIFYSNFYRTKYAEFLKMDFPRVPITINHELFTRLGGLGKKLIDLHLMKSKELKKPDAKFQGKGDNTVEKPIYDEKTNRLYINKTQFFEGIEKNVWEYYIGGYQVLPKWLKYRKGMKLSLDDIKHYCKVVTALKRTIEIQKEIDEIYPAVEKEIIEFKEKKLNASLDEYKQ